MGKRGRYLSWLFFLLGMPMSMETGGALDTIDLSEYRWKHRLLIVFAPSAQDARYQSLARELERERDKIIDRDLFVFLVFETGQSGVNQKVISKTAAEWLQRHFSITSGQFIVVLVGKDGGEKLRQESIVHVDEIFSLIDSMPMRQREMLEKPRE